MMMLPMIMLVALSDPIGLCDWTGVGLEKTEGVGNGMVAESIEETGAEVAGTSEAVALPPDGTTIGTLLGSPDEMGTSEAGILTDAVSVGVGVGTTPLPTEPLNGRVAEGVIPGTSAELDGVITALTDGVGATLSVSLGTMTGVPGVVTSPEAVGTAPDEISDKKLDTTLLAGGIIGALADGRGDSRIILDAILGRADAGKSGTADESKLETSATREDTRGGSTPDGVGAGDGVTGAVGPADPEGRTPETTSGTKEESIEGRFSGGALWEAASEVGIASELITGVGVGAPVPRAVVIPTTMPPVEETTIRGVSLDGTAAALVGERMLLGRTPVDPICGVGVGSGLSRMEERRPPTRFWEGVGVGCTTADDGELLWPGTMKGPRKVDEGLSGDGVG